MLGKVLVFLFFFVFFKQCLTAPALASEIFFGIELLCLLAEKERKQLSVVKVPRSYIPRSITPPPSLPKGWSLLFCVVAFTALLEIPVSLTMVTCAQLTAAKKSGQQTEDNVKSRTRASSIPRPRAVMSSPGNLHNQFKKTYDISAISISLLLTLPRNCTLAIEIMPIEL